MRISTFKQYATPIFIVVSGILLIAGICLIIALFYGIGNDHVLYRVYDDIPSPVPVEMYLLLQAGMIAMGWLWGWRFLYGTQEKAFVMSGRIILIVLGVLGMIVCLVSNNYSMLLTYTAILVMSLGSYQKIQEKFPRKNVLAVFTVLGGLGMAVCLVSHNHSIIPALVGMHLLSCGHAPFGPFVVQALFERGKILMPDFVVMQEFYLHTEYLIWRQAILFLFATLFFTCLRRCLLCRTKITDTIPLLLF